MAPVIRDRSKMVGPEFANIRGTRRARLGNPARYDLVSGAAPLGRPDYNLRDQLSGHAGKYPLFGVGRLAKLLNQEVVQLEIAHKLGGALASLRATGYGPFLIGLFALAFIGSGLVDVATAFYRRFDPENP